MFGTTEVPEWFEPGREVQMKRVRGTAPVTMVEFRGRFGNPPRDIVRVVQHFADPGEPWDPELDRYYEVAEDRLILD